MICIPKRIHFHAYCAYIVDMWLKIEVMRIFKDSVAVRYLATLISRIRESKHY